MKPAFFRSIILATLVAAGSLGLPAQQPGRMFVGETLVYEGKISRFRVSVSVAELTFTASASANSNELIVKSSAVSKGTLIKMFRYSFLQQYESTIDLINFRILKTTKHDVQKERVRDSEAVFDYTAKRVTFAESDPKDTMRPPRRIASEIGSEMLDMIAAIYYLRTQSLATGKRFELPVSDSGLVYNVPAAVTAQEQQNTIFGKKTACLRVEPDIFGPGRLIEQKGKMTIWMTDDARHIPVRAKVNSPYGTIEIKLKSATKPA